MKRIWLIAALAIGLCSTAQAQEHRRVREQTTYGSNGTVRQSRTVTYGRRGDDEGYRHSYSRYNRGYHSGWNHHDNGWHRGWYNHDRNRHVRQYQRTEVYRVRH